MKLKILTLAVFVAGLGASFALANDGHHGKGGDHGKKGKQGKCTAVHVSGTVAPQTLTVTVDRASKKLNLAAGSQVVLQLGAAGQTVRANAEACVVTVGSATQLQVKSLELKAKTPKSTTTTTGTTPSVSTVTVTVTTHTTTTPGTTTGTTTTGTTTTTPRKKHRH